MTEKIDALDLIINTLKEHEKNLDELIHDLSETAIKLEMMSLLMLRTYIGTKQPLRSEMPQWVKDLLESGIIEKALAQGEHHEPSR